jgi:ribosomal protein S18 acetylase RimI-like enzyme
MLRGWDEGFDVPSFGVLVDHRTQGQGLGRRMTEFAIAEARRLGSRRVRLTVNESNQAAVHLYRSLGFEEVSRSEFAGPAGRDMKLVMKRELGS